MSNKQKKLRLPNKILPILNKDKEFHESWYKGRNMLNIPHPFRAVLLGPPNVGKGTICKNILLRSYPPYKQVVIIHPDAEYTKEWDDIDAELLSEIPPPEEWDGEEKTMVIIDDMEFRGMNKIQKRNLDRLYGYVSTHKHISVLTCSQDAFNVPPIIRRCSNLWVLWRCPDLDAMATCARKTGMKSGNFNSIFNQLMLDTHDSLWIDMTKKSPYKMRKNGYTLINKQDGKDSLKAQEKEDKFNEE